MRWAETVLTHMHKAKTLQGICNASTSHSGGGGGIGLKVFLLCVADQYAKKRVGKKKHLSSWNVFAHPLLCAAKLCSAPRRSHRRREISPFFEIQLFFFRAVAAWALSLSLITFCNNRAMLPHMNSAVIFMNVLCP